MKHLALILTTAAILSACGAHTHSHGPVPPHPHPPLPQTGAATVERATDMCQVDTLSEQRLAMLEELHGYRETIQVDGRHSGSVADVRTQELIAAFETDLDASYRFATSSCRTYNRCLEENRFAEGSCTDTAELWDEGQDRFHDLSLRLAAVRERIATGCSDCSSASAPDPIHRHQRRQDPPPSDDLLGSVFSTSDHR